MFNFDKKPHIVALDEAISNILITMTGLSEDSPEYDAASTQLVKLMKLKQEIKPSWRPSPDAILGALGTIGTAILVLKFEKFGVITSKAFTFIGKLLR